MLREERKLFNDVSHILKGLYEIENKENVKVEYKPFNLKAYIFWPAEISKTGNGHERYFRWEVIDKLKEISDKYSISYKVGLTDNLELNIQIYVVSR